MTAEVRTGEKIGTGVKVGMAVTGALGFSQVANATDRSGGTMVAKDAGQWADAFNSFSVGVGGGGNFVVAPGKIKTL